MMAASPDQVKALLGQAPPMPSGSVPSTPSPTPPPTGGAPRTVMLHDSEGVVSFARQGGRAVEASEGRSGGSMVVFWIVCCITGLAIGGLAYFLVSQLK
jgi:hypothetical protein